MSMWTAIALIAIAGIVSRIFSDRGHKQGNKAVKAEFEAINNKLDKMEHDLRERVETLERIVTNPKEDLKRQFEHLDKVS